MPFEWSDDHELEENRVTMWEDLRVRSQKLGVHSICYDSLQKGSQYPLVVIIWFVSFSGTALKLIRHIYDNNDTITIDTS